MTDKEITREYNPINRIEVFKKRTDDFFATYENSSGGEDCLEVCLIRDGCRAVTQAEETINCQKEEIDSLKAECQAADGYEDALVKRTKAEAYKEFAENFVQKAKKTTIIYVDDTTIQEQETGWYQISIADFNNLLKELAGEGDA